MALVPVPGREKGELLRGEERGMGSCKGGRELQVNLVRPDRQDRNVWKGTEGSFFQKEGIYRISCIIWNYEISQGNRGEFFFWWFSFFYNRNTRHEELFGHTSLTGRKEL